MRDRIAACAAGDAYAAACRARAAYFEIEQYGAMTRAIAHLTNRASETLQVDARCAQYRDATLYTHARVRHPWPYATLRPHPHDAVRGLYH